MSLSPVGCTISVKEYSLNLKFFQVLNELTIVINILGFFFFSIGIQKGRKMKAL